MKYMTLEEQRQAFRWSAMLGRSDRQLKAFQSLPEGNRLRNQLEEGYDEIERELNAFEEYFNIDGDKMELFVNFIEESRE